MEKVSPKDLAKAVAPFENVQVGPGLLKMATHLALIIPLLALTWTYRDDPLLFVLFTVLGSFVYSSMMVTTHDAIHETFTGNRLIDNIYPRVISYPLFWFHGIYAEVHKLHHKMNGTDTRDPERIEYTAAEYAAASPLKKLYIRNQWFFNIFVFGGIGFIVRTVRSGAAFYGKSASMRRAFHVDFSGIILANIAIYSFMASKGLALQFFTFWLIYQYTVGVVLVFRAHIEHYGLWGKGDHFYDSQVLNCRNIRTNKFLEWYFNGLCHHSIHHAFPRVPFYALERAQLAMHDVYRRSGKEGVKYTDGYFGSAFTLLRTPLVIKDQPTGGISGSEALG